MNDAARRAPTTYRRVHTAAAGVAAVVALVALGTDAAGVWIGSVGAIAAGILAAEAATCRCFVDDAVTALRDRLAGTVR